MVKTTAFPVATCLAATWDTELLEKIGRVGALEVKENNMYIYLTPALNIHRSPLCGRNFEYYSEDPFLAGKMAAATVRGIQSQNIVATPKHFACNNKETNRKMSDSIVSERALREIYLRGFEICVKESKPKMLMTAYNIVNGVRASENVELVEGILRGEWGYEGMVTTDWQTLGDPVQELLAYNDIKMPYSYPDQVKAALENGTLIREVLCVCVKHILEMILWLE
jgi:beta-glucosidase